MISRRKDYIVKEVVIIKKINKFILIILVLIIFLNTLVCSIINSINIIDVKRISKINRLNLMNETKSENEVITKEINDNNDVLLNEGKGLVFYARRLTYDDENKYLLNHISQEMLDISKVVYTRYDWAELQKEEGVYDFSMIDEGIEDCIKYNKKFAFGVMCANVSTDEQYVTPKFVFDAGAKYKKNKQGQYIPDWEDETFLKYVNEFVEELGRRYNGNPNIAFIDIRSYGNFGEQHLFGLDVLDENGNVDDDYTWKNKIEPEFLREKYIEPYKEAFPDTLLVIPWGEDKFNSVYEELIDEGISLRRDGIITYENGLETCSKTYGKLPMIYEYASSYDKYEEDGGKEYFNRRLEEAMEKSKPSYIELDKQWYEDGNEEYCKELANRIGYYFRLKKVSYNSNIKVNTPSNISLEFKNDGITPICEDCSVYIGILNQSNKLVKKYRTEINPKNWEPGEISKENISVTLDDMYSGNYKIAVGLYKNDSDENPTYLIGSEGKTEDNWYVFGDVTVEGNEYNYNEKIMENPPTIVKVEDEKAMEDSTVWCTPKDDDGNVNSIYKSYNSILEPLEWRNSIIGQNSIYSTENEWPQLYSIEFVVNCKEFYINTCTSFRILVDEGNGYEITDRDGIKQTTKETGTTSDSFKGVWHKITFDEKKERKIRVELTDCVFNGVRIYKEDEIKPITRESNQKVLFVGSSITRGADYEAYYSWPNVVSNILGLECINNGVGGTGYLADCKGANDAYYDRLVYLMEKLNPDVIVLEAGPNDYWSSYEADEVLPEAKKCVEYIKNNSNAKIIMIGAYYPSMYVPDGLKEINDKLREYALENKIPFIDWLTGDTYNEEGEKITEYGEPYITGSGDTGKNHGDGNADIYVSEDSVHLSIEGNKYFGEKLAVEFKKLLYGIEEEKPEVPSKKSDIRSLYCWEIGDFNLSKLQEEVDKLDINTLYVQNPANETETERLKQIMKFAKEYNLDVFLLDGGRDFLTTGDKSKVIDLIDLAYELNQTLDYKLKGVSLDVEFYLTEDYQSADTERQQELFKIYTKNIKECCDYANSKGLGYSFALPVWLNKLSMETLEDLMNYNYDHIAFMNYYRPTIMENIDEEVQIAKKYNINIVTIAELQNPEYGTVEEYDTFYGEGLDNAIDTLNKMKEKYNYENLGVSYHYYKPLLDLLEENTEIENKYELEVHPYINEESIKADEAIITDSNGNILKPIDGYHSSSGEYIENFYGLEYGKEYTLTVKSGNLMGTKTFTYQKGDKALDKLEIAYMDIELDKENPDPTPSNPDPVDPTPSNPDPVDPTPSNPDPVDPTPSNPDPVDPTPSNPDSVDPTPSNPDPVDPTPSNPDPADPTPSNPDTADPAPSNPKPSDPSQNNPEQKDDNKKDNTVAPSDIPYTGKKEITIKLIVLSMIIAIGVFTLIKYKKIK